MGFLGGIAGSMAGSFMSGLLDSVLGDDDINAAPIPAFYFEVDFYSPDSTDYKKETYKSPESGGLGGTIAGALSNAISAALPSTSFFLDPGSVDPEKAFVEVSGIEMGLEGKKTFNEGGYNFPIDLPDKMKNTAITLKRLIRPSTLNDKWYTWYMQTFTRMAYWHKKIDTKIVQVNIMHPNMGDSGKPIILSSINFFDSYPSKLTLTPLNSTGEDLMMEEIEISYSNCLGSYMGTGSSSPDLI